MYICCLCAMLLVTGRDKVKWTTQLGNSNKSPVAMSRSVAQDHKMIFTHQFSVEAKRTICAAALNSFDVVTICYFDTCLLTLRRVP